MTGAKAKLDSQSSFGSFKANFWQKLIWQLCDWHPLPQKWRQKLRKKFARKVVGPFDIVHDTMRYRLYPAENYCDRVLFGRDELPVVCTVAFYAYQYVLQQESELRSKSSDA